MSISPIPDGIRSGRRATGSTTNYLDHAGPGGGRGRTDVLGAGGLLGLQRRPATAAVTAWSRTSAHRCTTSSPPAVAPLDPEVRTDMEARLGHDFGDVRVHDDAAAAESAKAVNAHAYTVGSNIVFQRDIYDPVVDSGADHPGARADPRVQQRSGPVDGTSAPGGINGQRPVRPVRAGGGGQRRAGHGRSPASPVGAPAAPAVQRQAVRGQRNRSRDPSCSGSGAARRRRSRSRVCSSSVRARRRKKQAPA